MKHSLTDRFRILIVGTILGFSTSTVIDYWGRISMAAQIFFPIMLTLLAILSILLVLIPDEGARR